MSLLTRARSATELELTLFAGLSTLVAGLYLLMAAMRGRKGWKRLPPGPWLSVPFFGDLTYLSKGDPVAFFFDRYKRYGPVYSIVMMGARIWVVADKEAVKGVLNDRGATLDIPFPAFKHLMGQVTLFQGEGTNAPWRKMFITSVLGPPRLAELAPHVLRVLRAHLAAWQANGNRMPMYTSARTMGIDLSVDVVGQVQWKHKDPAWVKEQLELFLDGLYGLPLAYPGSPLTKALAAKERLLDALEPELKELHAAFLDKWEAAGRCMSTFIDKATAAHARGEAGVAERPTPPVMQLIGRAHLGQYTLREAALGVLHILMAAGDTNRYFLFNLWALLAGSPRVQERIFEEQAAVVAAHGPGLSYKATCHMPYTEAAVREAMRLLPATPGSFRRLTEDLRVGEYTVPKGECIMFYAPLLHCVDPALYDGGTAATLPKHMDWRNSFDDIFRPERWLEGGGGGGGGNEDVRPRSYYVFGTGAHQCVGMNLAYMEIKLLLALVVRQYRLRLETPDMLRRCTRLFPLIEPAPGTDALLLEPRGAPLPTE